MAIRYKINIIEALKDKGISTYKIRKEKIFGESTLQMFRRGEFVSSGNNLDLLCKLLEKQPGEIIEYVTDEK